MNGALVGCNALVGFGRRQHMGVRVRRRVLVITVVLMVVMVSVPGQLQNPKADAGEYQKAPNDGVLRALDR